MKIISLRQEACLSCVCLKINQLEKAISEDKHGECTLYIIHLYIGTESTEV